MQTDLQVWTLILHASWMVKFVMLTLLAASVASWMIIFRKRSMLHGAVRLSPVYGAEVEHFDAGGIASYPGVEKVVPVPGGVVVVADTWWRAKQAADALETAHAAGIIHHEMGKLQTGAGLLARILERSQRLRPERVLTAVPEEPTVVRHVP